MVRWLCRGVLVSLIGAGIIGCQSKAGTGALVGGAGGAAAGAAIGSLSHSHTGEGALIGAAVGAIGGALIGHGMDKADEREARERETQREYDRGHAAGDRDFVTKSDVILWTQRGVHEDVIIDRIDRSGTIYHLTAADVNTLRDKGVSEPVIRAMEDTSRR